VKTESKKQFVLQRHTRENESVHWDLMLDNGNELETYRIDTQPENLRGKSIQIVKIFNHDRKFLTYQGSVNKGKGRVEIADRGEFSLLKEKSGIQEIQLHGQILNCKLTLSCIESNKWLAKFHS
jgi:hypothetical protein